MSAVYKFFVLNMLCAYKKACSVNFDVVTAIAAARCFFYLKPTKWLHFMQFNNNNNNNSNKEEKEEEESTDKIKCNWSGDDIPFGMDKHFHIHSQIIIQWIEIISRFTFYKCINQQHVGDEILLCCMQWCNVCYYCIHIAYETLLYRNTGILCWGFLFIFFFFLFGICTLAHTKSFVGIDLNVCTYLCSSIRVNVLFLYSIFTQSVHRLFVDAIFLFLSLFFSLSLK